MMIEALQQLNPLPLRHYCYPFNQQVWSESPELVREICRLMGSIPCWLKDVSTGHADFTSDAMVVEIGAIAADLAVPVGLFHAPWLDTPIDDGTAIENELVQFERRCDNLKELFGDRVAWIQIDDEAWESADPAKALPHRLLLIEILKYHWPQIEISWYNWGGFISAHNDAGWHQQSTYGVPLDAVNVACYRGPHLELIHEAIRRTAASTELPLEMNISFGGGYRPAMGHKYHAYDSDWQYSTDYSWWLGWIMTNRVWCSQRAAFAPYDRLRAVCIWPQLLSPSRPTARDHFLAYCKGANDVKD